MKFHRPWQLLPCLILLLIVLLTACGGNNPPKGLAPGGEIIKHAIARKLTLTEDRLSNQLQNPTSSEFQVKNVTVKTLNPIYIAGLPTYQINGTYTLKLKLPRQEVTQNKNEFEVYLQRQVEGKTWRLLIPEQGDGELEKQEQATVWKSYLVT